MIPLNDQLWTEMHHAFGSAVDLPELLERLEGDPSQENWTLVWDHLCPDGELYSASFAALPHLVRLANTNPADERFDYLLLVGAILIHGEGHQLADVLRRPIEDIRDELINSTIAAIKAKPMVEEQAVYLLCTLCAALGYMDLARALPKLSTDELRLHCPACHAHLALWYTKDGLGIFEIDAEDSGEGVAIASEGKMPTVLQESRMTQRNAVNWLCPLAAQAGFLNLAERIHQFFGKVCCPACDACYKVAPRILG